MAYRTRHITGLTQNCELDDGWKRKTRMKGRRLRCGCLAEYATVLDVCWKRDTREGKIWRGIESTGERRGPMPN